MSHIVAAACLQIFNTEKPVTRIEWVNTLLLVHLIYFAGVKQVGSE